MATLKTNTLKSGYSYTVEWRTGGSRTGAWCHETFKDDKEAAFFKADVERHGHQYPPNYVPHYGYVTAEELAASNARIAAEEAAKAVVAPVYFKDRVEAFLATLDVEGRTEHDYRQQFTNHLLPAFGDLVVNAAAEVPDDGRWDADAVKVWVKRLHRGVRDPEAKNNRWELEPRSPKTIRNLHALLSSYGGWLVGKGLLGINPCAGTSLPESAEGEADAEMVFLERHEFALLYEAAGADARDLIKFLVGTGLRYSEATALKLKDLHLDGDEPYLMVRRAWKRQADHSHRIGRPKSKASRRRVELAGNKPIVTMLTRLRIGRDGEEYVFLAPTGVHWRHANFYNRPWTQAVYKAVRCARHRAEDGITNMHDLKRRHAVPCGCPGMLTKVPRIHDLRHTCAALMIERGVSLLAVQRQFGHESYSTTEKRYGHLTKGAKRAMGEASADFIDDEELIGIEGAAAALTARFQRQDRQKKRQRMLASGLMAGSRRG